MPDLVPRALVLRFFLAPDNFGGIGELFHKSAYISVGEWIQLLHSHDRYATSVFRITFFRQFVVDLAGTKNDTFDFIGVAWSAIANHQLEASFGKYIELGGRCLAAQQTFGRHHNQWFARGL